MIAQTAGSILDRETFRAGVGRGIKVGEVELCAIALGELADKGLVAVAVARAKMEVAVGYGEGESGEVHEMAQHGRVDPTTNGKQPFLPGAEKAAGLMYEVVKGHYLLYSILRIRRVPSISMP